MVTPIIERQSATTKVFTEVLGADMSLEMVLIPSGTFLMGSPANEPARQASEDFQHQVSVASFYMGRYPVTQEQWQLVAQFPKITRDLDLKPSHFDGARLPVEGVSWYDAQEFCDRLSAATNHPYRLPTESEWEYACRGGTNTPFYCGATITTDISNYGGSSTYGQGPKGEYREQTTPVDYFDMSNPLGLHDMHGNVLEWCQDHWHETYDGAPTDGTAWLKDGNDSYRILRGGSWDSFPRYCRSASRNHSIPDNTINSIGFRIVLAPR